MSQPHAHLSPDAIYPFDARGVAKRFRHAAIFGALDSLQPGETMRFVNDHDPLPLLSQLAQRYGDRVGVEYRQREPGVIVIDFSVEINRCSRVEVGKARFITPPLTPRLLPLNAAVHFLAKTPRPCVSPTPGS